MQRQSLDKKFMQRALELARRAEGRVHPNPMVGAVLVRGGRVLSEGAHERFGLAHAEVNALRKLKKIPSGATLYLTLEPCDHFGKTPPCTRAILDAGIRRVVVAMKDPNPRVAGRGIRRLQKNGVSVRIGVLGKEARELNRHYEHWVKSRRPYVTVKVGQSLDGKIATSTGESRWITGNAARRRAHGIRRSADAILVGVNTLLRDNPLLTVRLPGQKTQPLKVILDSSLRTNPRSAVFSRRSPGPVLIFTARRALKRARRFRGKADIVAVPEKKGLLDWSAVLRELGRRGITHLLIEGGGEVIGSAFAKRLVQEAYFFTAPRLIGGKSSIGSVGGPGVTRLAKSAPFKQWDAERIGGDLLIHGRL